MSAVMPYIGLEEISSNKVGTAKALVAELLGTLILVFVGVGSCLGGDAPVDHQAQYVRIALCFGVTVATVAQTIGHVSGCHINPAVTAGLITGAKIGLIKGLLYMVAQSIGAILGAGILRVLVPASSVRGAEMLGCTTVNEAVTTGQAFGVEFIITMVLVLVVFGAAADANNAHNVKGSAPLAIGLSITTCHLFAIPLTGSSMNPARSLGSALVSGLCWDNHWLYWLGPISGGVAAALIYQLLLKAPEPQRSEYSGVAQKDNGV